MSALTPEMRATDSAARQQLPRHTRTKLPLDVARRVVAPFLPFEFRGSQGGMMALREFTDADGNRWKAWDVTSDQIHPKTKAEDYMHDLADGWLVFERWDGEEKRRLCPYPHDWEESTDAGLLTLFSQADHVQRRQTSSLGSWRVGDTPIAPSVHREQSTPDDIPRRPVETKKDSRGEEKPTR